jgi:hypothetical protein
MKQILLLQNLLHTNTTEESTYYNSFDFFITQIKYKEKYKKNNQLYIITYLEISDLATKLNSVDKRFEVHYE